MQSWESKPEVILITPVPTLSACPLKGGMWANIDQFWHHMLRYANEKLPKVFENAARETGVKLINMHNYYRGRDHKELCEI